MQKELQNAYARGYNAGLRRAWPVHKPPFPPDPIIHGLMNALFNLRERVDGFTANFDEDDPLTRELGPAMEEADAAMTAVAKWLEEE